MKRNLPPVESLFYVSMKSGLEGRNNLLSIAESREHCESQ